MKLTAMQKQVLGSIWHQAAAGRQPFIIGFERTVASLRKRGLIGGLYVGWGWEGSLTPEGNQAIMDGALGEKLPGLESLKGEK